MVLFAAVVVLTAGCGDGNDGESTAAANDASGGSGGGSGGGTALAISGKPPSQILQGTKLDFKPTVSNPNGVSLSFAVTNLPAWASIDSATGRITGTPSAADVGTYSGIKLTASGGGQSVTSPAYTIEVVATANGSATLTWLPPTEHTDGSPLTDLSAFRIYWGQSRLNLSNSVKIDGGLTAYVVDQLTPSTWYFAVTALDSQGIESAFSAIASKTVLD